MKNHGTTSLGLTKLFFLGIASLVYIRTNAQNAIEPSIKLIVRSFEDSIVLRWAPNTPFAWQLLNQYGYRIERYTLVRDSVVLKDKSQKILISGLKPFELTRWEPHAKKDNMVAIAAQAIYGKSFTVSNNKSMSVGDVINLSREQESRFSFALFACDVSSSAATLSGLRWVDKGVRKNEKYLYRVYSVVPENELKINFGFAFVATAEVAKLLPPREPTIKFSDRVALLEWEPNPLRDMYIGYYVERSDDGKIFKRISKLPIAPILDKNGNFQAMNKFDSLSLNEKEFYYRIQGLTPFGDVGPYSNSVSGQGISPIKVRAFITDYKIVKEGKVLVSWKFPKENEKEIKGFDLERSNKTDGTYIALNKRPIDPTQRSFEDASPNNTNYYRVLTIGKSGQKVTSHAYLVQLQDSIPPVMPSGLKASIDTTGIITLAWNKNIEPDLAGYHIYRSNFSTSEFSRISKNPIRENSFIDTLNLQTLTNKVFYKITAIDTRQNPSAFSSTIRVIKPDVVPPVPPQIESVRSMPNGIRICWIKSASEDVGVHRLFRKDPSSQNWVEVRPFFRSDSTCFIDRPSTKNLYQYKIVAEDSVMHQSNSPVFSAKLTEDGIRPIINDISAEINRTQKKITLSWKYKVDGVAKYQIFRAAGEEKISLLKTVTDKNSYYEDFNLVTNSSYKYLLKVIFKDGSESKFSKPVTIEY
jgi:fibronectin type 3 domain-containing protein